MDKFDIKKITAQLKKVNKNENKDIYAGIQIILNNMEIYNTLIDNFDHTKSKELYIIYQLSVTLFKQLEKFGVFPYAKTLKESEKEDSFTIMKKRVIGKK